MLKVLVACCVATVWLQMPSGAYAECCRKHSFSVKDSSSGNWQHGKLCGDCSAGTPHCSHGGCNIFGCNCDGGCRSGLCNGAKLSFQKRGLRMRSDDGLEVIRAADVDGDGRMSLEEAKLHQLASTGLPAHHVKRALEQLDYNQDQFITAHEIDVDSQ